MTPPSEYPQAGRSDISQDSMDQPTFEKHQRQWLNDLKSRGAKIVQVTYPRTANNDKELTVVRGEYLEVSTVKSSCLLLRMQALLLSLMNIQKALFKYLNYVFVLAKVLDDSRKWWKAVNARGQVAHVPHTIVTPYAADQVRRIMFETFLADYLPYIILSSVPQFWERGNRLEEKVIIDQPTGW